MEKNIGPDTQKAIYFISDAHLSSESKQVEDIIAEFLKSIRDRASHLYILGDLFDFWLEYKNAIPSAYLKTLAALLALNEAGVEITYLPGNHDFWMVDYLQRQAGIKIADVYLDIVHDGKKIHLFHGDGLAYGDHGYRFIKKLFRFKPLIWLYKQLPVDLAYRIAHRSSHASRTYTSKQPKDLQGYYDYAEAKIKSGYDAVIMGHTHEPEIRELAGGLYINTGDWIWHNSYVVLSDGKFDLKYFETEP
jgi:UDP-2,3-diacylglucosamine hydrolase